MKYSIVLNPSHPLPTQLNALGHACVGLGDLVAPSASEMRSFVDAEGRFIGRMTDHPLIVLSARNAKQMQDICTAAQEGGVQYNIFPIDMKDGSPAAQEESVRTQQRMGLEIVAVAMFGDSDTLRNITRKCSLFRG